MPQPHDTDLAEMPIVSGARLGRLLQTLASQPLTALQVLLFYLAALGLYVLPLILDNVLFIDDNLREMQAATWWKPEGRPLGDYLFNAVSFTPGTPDFFPLSMLLAILVMAVALAHLAFHWFRRPTLSHCLVLLPLWYNPFYLQELSYQYECLTLSLGVALVVLAISFSLRAAGWQVLVRGAMLAAAMSLDQLPLNVFVGLACVDLLRQTTIPATFRALLWQPLQHLAVLLAGGVFYYLTAYQLLMNDRGGVIWPSLQEWGVRLGALAGKVGLFITPANGWVFALLALCALAGLGLTLATALRTPVRAGLKAAYLAITALATVGAVLAVGGLLLVLYDFGNNSDARTLVGVAPLLVALLLLAHGFIARLAVRWTLVLALPLAVFLSFAYVYGQYLREQNELQQFVRTLVVTDIFNHPQVSQASSISLLEDNNNDINNVFARVCVQRMLPALRFIAANDYQFLPEQLRKWGVTTLADESVDLATLGAPVVSRPFYGLYVVGDKAYIRFAARVSQPECPALE